MALSTFPSVDDTSFCDIAVALPIANLAALTGVAGQADIAIREGASRPVLSESASGVDQDFLCPIIDSKPIFKCDLHCYFPNMYSPENDRLVHPLKESDDGLRDRYICDEEASRFALCRFALCNSHYTKYVYSLCNFATQVVVTSPLPNNNLTIIGPRLLAGAGFTPVKSVHSGLVAYFEPQIGVNGSLTIGLQNSSETGHALEPIYEENDEEGYFIVSVSGLLKFNSSATITVHILGGIRTILDFSEDPNLLKDVIEDAMKSTS
ncbi:hypothetical protein K4K52_004494 [Colletotrichum sp. SAR 10_76]|nr:hypothetical protein K4K52_004494 [Colletotrichum sp. SAR 10_76]